MVQHNHLTRDIKAPGKCPACDETRRRVRKLTMTKPTKKMSRDDLIAWLEVNGDQDAREAFIDGVKDWSPRRMPKDDVLAIAEAAYKRAQA